MPGALLVAFTELFGIKPGTARVALSRMVEAGELVRNSDGYELAGPLVARQARQGVGLEPGSHLRAGDDGAAWDGTWDMIVVRSGARDPAQRAALRRACSHLGHGELREGVWVRPGNLRPDRLPDAAAVVTAQADRFAVMPDGDQRELAARVFDLDGWARRARELMASMTGQADRLGSGPDALPVAFVVAADVLRHLVADPVVPPEVAPVEWPAVELRSAYRKYEAAFRVELAAFFRTIGR